MQKGQNIHFTLGGNFQFSARGKRYVYLKKVSPLDEFHLAYINMLKQLHETLICKTKLKG